MQLCIGGLQSQGQFFSCGGGDGIWWSFARDWHLPSYGLRQIDMFFGSSLHLQLLKLITRAVGVFQCLAYGMLVRVDAIKSSSSRFTYLTKL